MAYSIKCFSKVYENANKYFLFLSFTAIQNKILQQSKIPITITYRHSINANINIVALLCSPCQGHDLQSN